VIDRSVKLWNKLPLCASRASLAYHGFLKLEGIPPKFEYRLGNRSALEWVIDPYHVSTTNAAVESMTVGISAGGAICIARQQAHVICYIHASPCLYSIGFALP
jgi:hypothetical protein